MTATMQAPKRKVKVQTTQSIAELRCLPVSDGLDQKRRSLWSCLMARIFWASYVCVRGLLEVAY